MQKTCGMRTFESRTKAIEHTPLFVIHIRLRRGVFFSSFFFLPASFSLPLQFNPAASFGSIPTPGHLRVKLTNLQLDCLRATSSCGCVGYYILISPPSFTPCGRCWFFLYNCDRSLLHAHANIAKRVHILAPFCIVRYNLIAVGDRWDIFFPLRCRISLSLSLSHII